MSVLAMAEITLSFERDISSVHRFYKIAASTTTPAAWTASQTADYIANGTIVSGWSLTEPAYDNTTTNSLYFFDLTVFSDNTYNKTDISKSSSYEAAKQAYEEAIAAQDAAATIEQYFWHDSNGAHVTTTPKDQFIANPTGGNTVIDSDSIEFKDGATSLAEFGISGARIGQISGKNVLMDSNGININNGPDLTLANFTGTGASFSTSSLQNAVKIRTGTAYGQIGGQIAFGGSNDNTITGTSKNGYSDLSVILETGIETGNPHTVHGIGFRANSTANGKYAWLDLNPEEGSTIESHTSTGKGASLILDNDGGVSLLAYNSSNEGAIWINPTSISLSVPVEMERSAPRIDLIDESTEQTLRVLANSNGNKGLFFPTSDTASSSNYWLIRSDVDGVLYLGKAPKIGSHDSVIGTVKTANDTVSNLASSTDIAKQTSAKLALGAGTWVITGTVRYTSNATGRRSINLYAGTDAYEATFVTVPAASGTTTKIQTTLVTAQSSDFTVYIGMQQNSGSALNGQWYIRAVRIA